MALLGGLKHSALVDCGIVSRWWIMAQRYLVDCGLTAFGGLQQGTIWWTLTWYSFVDCSMALFGDCGIPVSLNLWFVFWGLCFIICPSGRAYMQQCPGQLTYSSHGARFVHASAIHSAFPPFNHACIHLCIYVCAFVRAQVLP